MLVHIICLDGTLSAWATFTSLGFYPQAGTINYALGSPIFPNVIIHRSASQGGDLYIQSINNTADNIYVQSVTLDGVPLSSPFITHNSISHTNATIVFYMTDTPAPQFN